MFAAIGEALMAVGAICALGIVALFVYLVISFMRFGDDSLCPATLDDYDDFGSAPTPSVSSELRIAARAENIEHMTLEQLMDESIVANATLKRIELQVCRLLATSTDGSEPLYDAVIESVYDGANWPYLFSEFSKLRRKPLVQSSAEQADAVV